MATTSNSSEKKSVFDCAKGEITYNCYAQILTHQVRLHEIYLLWGKLVLECKYYVCLSLICSNSCVTPTKKIAIERLCREPSV
jgi:hypothetical protein